VITYRCVVTDDGPGVDGRLVVYAQIGDQQHDVLAVPAAMPAEADRLLAAYGWRREGEWADVGGGSRVADVDAVEPDALVAGVTVARLALEQAQADLRDAVITAEARRRAAGAVGVQGAPAQQAIADAAGLGSRETVAAWWRAGQNPR
jgi:hypothetical protein